MAKPPEFVKYGETKIFSSGCPDGVVSLTPTYNEASLLQQARAILKGVYGANSLRVSGDLLAMIGGLSSYGQAIETLEMIDSGKLPADKTHIANLKKIIADGDGKYNILL